MMADSDERVIKCGPLIKKAVVKRKRFAAENYKDRYFELTNKSLKYFDGNMQNHGKLKGSILLFSMKIIREVEDKRLDDKSNVFQIVYEEKKEFPILYVCARTPAERQAWLTTIADEAARCGAQFFPKYHPGVWTKKLGYYNCCDQCDKNAIGCKSDASRLNPDHFAQKRDLTPVPPPRPETAEGGGQRLEYIALFDYDPPETRDLELIQGEKYIILNKSAENWWYAENREGKKGYIPANYVKPNSGLDQYEWYYKNCSREESTRILLNSKKDGCFLVRDSISTKGSYSLSIYTNENNGNVRHYKIRQDNSGRYYVSEAHIFDTIPELVFYHKHNSGDAKASTPDYCLNHRPVVPLHPLLDLATEICRLSGAYCTPEYVEEMREKNKDSTVRFEDWNHGYKWQLDEDNLKYGKELGRGCFGVVYEGTYRAGHKRMAVAIKEMYTAPQSDEFLLEFKTMTQLYHPNIVQLYGVIIPKSDDNPKIVTELLVNGDLRSYLIANKANTAHLNQDKLLDFALQVCSGMEYLNDRHIIHRDLAARNCLVGTGDVVKVADFGLAREVVVDFEYQMAEKSKFPFKWSPPEVLHYRKYTEKSDVWSYGILMWEIYSFGEMPYHGMKNHEVTKYVAVDNKRLGKPQAAPEVLYSMMLHCWHQNCEQRPSFNRIKVKLGMLSQKGEYIPTDLG